MTTRPEDFVDGVLAGLPKNGRKCKVCDNEPLSRAIVRFLDLKAEGQAPVPFTWFYREKLQDHFDGPSQRTAQDHARRCLNRDVTTGKVVL